MRCQNFRSRGEIFTGNAIDLRIKGKAEPTVSSANISG